MAHPWSTVVASIDAAPTTRVGPATTVATFAGWRGVTANPADLHRITGLDRNVYALARTIASEAAGPGVVLLALAESIRNEATARGVEPYQLLVGFTSIDASRWRYGEQRGRYATTLKDPTVRTVAAAKAAVGQSTDLAHGAARWLGPRTQDAQHDKNPATHTLDAIGIAGKWGLAGWRWIGPLPDVDSYRNTAFFRHVDAPTDNADLVEVIKLGRAGKATVGASSPDKVTAEVARRGAPGWLLAGAAVAVAGLVL